MNFLFRMSCYSYNCLVTIYWMDYDNILIHQIVHSLSHKITIIFWCRNSINQGDGYGWAIKDERLKWFTSTWCILVYTIRCLKDRVLNLKSWTIHWGSETVNRFSFKPLPVCSGESLLFINSVIDEAWHSLFKWIFSFKFDIELWPRLIFTLLLFIE